MMNITPRPSRLVLPLQAAVLLASLAVFGLAVDAQAQTQPLKAKVSERFQVLLMRQSVVLVPKTPIKGLTNIELTDGSVLVDGSPLTGKELRALLGGDADVVVQLSYLDDGARRLLFEEPKAPAIPATAAPAPAEPPSTESTTDDWSTRTRSRSGGARFRIGGDVVVQEDEQVRNDVIAVFGSARINGRVDGEVVAVGGSVVLGPKSDVRGSVTSVGGAIERSGDSHVTGEINEVRMTMPSIRPYFRVQPWHGWSWFSSPFGASVELVGTIVRIGIIGLLAVLIVTVFPSKVQSISNRVAAEPWRAAVTGLAAQILFVPLLVLTVVVLAVSIIGIPLLLLVPFVLVALLAALLLGFTGVGAAIGGQFGRHESGSLRNLVVPVVVGLAIIWALTVIARFVGLAGSPLRIVVGGVLLVGFIVEYVAWTVGLGGVLLSRFGRRDAAPRSSQPPPFDPAAGPTVPGL